MEESTMRHGTTTALFALILALLPVTVAGTTGGTSDVEATLDAFHAAASRADETAYFELFAPEGVFLGTAPGERWTVAEFRAYVHPYFSEGRGWTYEMRERHVGLGPHGETSWFDEVLHNDKYGETRGSGVLRRIDGAWRIVQYNLTIPIPNGMAADVVEMIRAQGD
jgi:hypothetical protein